MLASDDGGGSAYGFTVPQGDPGALRSAATDWATLGSALTDAKSSVTTAVERALSAGGWTGGAASAFTARAEDLLKSIGGAIEAAATAQGALDALASELEQAQSTTRTALSDCGSAESTYITQSSAAQQAGDDADTKQRLAQSSADPSAATELTRQATASRQAQQTANGLADQAQSDLSAAETRGQNAVTAYDTAAAQIAQRLQAAAAELVPAQDDGDWQEAVLKWVDHALTFFGAGTVAVGKGYEAAFMTGVKQMNDEIADYLSSDAVLAADATGELPRFTPNDASLWDDTEKAFGDSEDFDKSALNMILNEGFVGEDVSPVLGKVPVIGVAFTGLDVAHNLSEGENPAEAVGVPLVNLGLATGIGEVASTAVAAGATALAGGGELLIAGSALIPGVGEVVIAGAITVAAVYAIDQGATWLWDHGGSKLAHQAWNDVTSAVSHPVQTVEHIAHDLNPFNW